MSHTFHFGPLENRCGFLYPMTGDKCGMSPEDHPGSKKALAPERKVQESSQAVLAFSAYSEAVLGLVRRKDEAYGGAWQEQGYMGNLARILSKAARLKNLMWQDTPYLSATDIPQDESVLDTLKDLMALCAFMGANIEDGNRWGHGPKQ